MYFIFLTLSVIHPNISFSVDVSLLTVIYLLQFCSVLAANILKAQGVVANCTITNVVLGSVKVSNTLAFTGSDTAAAEAARNSVATALSSTDSTDYFGTTFGDVSVSDIATVTTANPTGVSSFNCQFEQASLSFQHIIYK